MTRSDIAEADPRKLIPYCRNARTHSAKQIQQIANSITRFGFLNPVLVDDKNMILAGHGRVQAAIKLGLAAIPVRSVSHLSGDEKRAYILADNKLAEKAGWDQEILAIELQHLLGIEGDLDISLTGFEMPEIDMIILGGSGDNKIPEPPPPPPEETIICAPGDLWQLGSHRIFCGNALKESSYETLMENEKADLVFTDPPYNVPIAGHVCGKGSIKHREFAMASGEMSSDEFTGFLETAFRHLVRFSCDGSIHYICMDWRHLAEITNAGNRIYTELKNLCIWNKDNGGMGSLYRSKHELVFVFKNGNVPHVNNVELGVHGRYRTNVWDYPGVNTLRNGRQDELAMHPTVKPVSMIMDAILDCSRRNDIVLDSFGGSGSTLIAAERSGRKARLIEMDPAYVDVTIRRWQQETGQSARHAVSGLTFAERKS